MDEENDIKENDNNDVIAPSKPPVKV